MSGSLIHEYVEELPPLPFPHFMYKTIDGNGNQTPSTAYRNQGVDVDVREPWRRLSERTRRIDRSRSLDVKYPGVTPLGARVADLMRTGGEMLIAPCGNCGVPMDRHRCDFKIDAR